MPDLLEINEPIGRQRDVSVRLLNSGNGGVGGLTGFTVRIAKPGGDFAIDAGCSVTEVTGASDPGTYRLRLSADAVSVDGEVEFEIIDSTGTGLFVPCHGYVTVQARRGALYYGPISAGGATTMVLSGPDASATDNFYAGGGRDCVALIVAGTGAGQANLASGYVGASKTLSFPIAWATNPDATSIVRLLPLHGQLDAATITAIQSGLASAANLATANTNINTLITGQSRITGLLQDNSMIDQITWGSNNVIVSARVRVFASAAALAAAVSGHANGADGEVFRYTISAVDIGSGQFSSYSKSRSL